MSKAIVIYSSKRGSTKQYAEWIAEDLCCEAIENFDSDAYYKRLKDGPRVTTTQITPQRYLEYFEQFKQLNISGLNGWGDAPGNIMVVNIKIE